MFNNYGPYMYQPQRFNFSNLLNNASKTLNVINQAIPIVKEAKPIINNARTVFKIMNGLNNNINNSKIYNITKEENNINTGPNFFI